MACVLDRYAKVEALLVPKQNESGTRMGGCARARKDEIRDWSVHRLARIVRSFGRVGRGTVSLVRVRLPFLSIDCLWYALTVL